MIGKIRMPKTWMKTSEILNWLYEREMSRGDLNSFAAWLKREMPGDIYARRWMKSSGTEWSPVHVVWIAENIHDWEDHRGIPEDQRIQKDVRFGE